MSFLPQRTSTNGQERIPIANCAICQGPANLKHILCGCKTSLAQGQYKWRHNMILHPLVCILEQRRVKVNAGAQKGHTD